MAKTYFKEFLLEVGNSSKYEKSAELITSYLSKNIVDFKRLPGVERFSGDDTGFGLRFFFGIKSLRINYKGSSVNSIDLWTKGKYDADYRLDLSKVSIASALPQILKIIKSPKIGEHEIMTESADNAILVTAAPKTEIISKEADKLDKLTNYEQQLIDLNQLATGVLKDNLSNALFICGSGGVGKTFTVEGALKKLGFTKNKDFISISGAASPPAIYKKMCDYKNGVFLFDDCDSILKSEDGRNLIKAATDTKKVRTIGWEKNANFIYNPDKLTEANFDAMKFADDAIAKNKKDFKYEDDDTPAKSKEDLVKAAEAKGMYPNRYEFTGKVIFISNLSLDKLDPDGSIRTRSFVLEMTPTNDEILIVMKKIVNNMDIEGTLGSKERLEVIDVLEKHPKILNMRKLLRGLNLRAAGFKNWEDLLIRYG